MQGLEVASGLAYEWHTGRDYEWDVPPTEIVMLPADAPLPIASSAAPAAAEVRSGTGQEAASFAFNVFTLSAVDCQKLEGVRDSDGPPMAFSSASHTEVPALR